MAVYENIRDFSQDAHQLNPIYNIFSKYLWVYKRPILYELQGISYYELDETPEKYPIQVYYKIDKNSIKNSYIINSYRDFIFHKLKFQKIQEFEQFWTYNIPPNNTFYSLDIRIEDSHIVEIHIYISQDINKWNYIFNLIPEKILLFIKRHLMDYNGFVEITYTEDLIIRNISLKRGFSIFLPYRKIIYSKIEKLKLMNYDIMIKDINDNCFVLFY